MIKSKRGCCCVLLSYHGCLVVLFLFLFFFVFFPRYDCLIFVGPMMLHAIISYLQVGAAVHVCECCVVDGGFIAVLLVLVALWCCQDVNLEHHTSGEGYIFVIILAVSAITSTLILHQYFFRVGGACALSCLRLLTFLRCLLIRCSVWGSKFDLRSSCQCTGRFVAAMLCVLVKLYHQWGCDVRLPLWTSYRRCVSLLGHGKQQAWVKLSTSCPQTHGACKN